MKYYRNNTSVHLITWNHALQWQPHAPFERGSHTSKSQALHPCWHSFSAALDLSTCLPYFCDHRSGEKLRTPGMCSSGLVCETEIQRFLLSRLVQSLQQQALTHAKAKYHIQSLVLSIHRDERVFGVSKFRAKMNGATLLTVIWAECWVSIDGLKQKYPFLRMAIPCKYSTVPLLQYVLSSPYNNELWWSHARRSLLK